MIRIIHNLQKFLFYQNIQQDFNHSPPQIRLICRWTYEPSRQVLALEILLSLEGCLLRLDAFPHTRLLSRYSPAFLSPTRNIAKWPMHSGSPRPLLCRHRVPHALRCYCIGSTRFRVTEKVFVSRATTYFFYHYNNIYLKVHNLHLSKTIKKKQTLLVSFPCLEQVLGQIFPRIPVIVQ